MDEIEVDKLVIHHWQKQENDVPCFLNCNYNDCSHTIAPGDTYYMEIHPEGHCLSYCLECSAFFMAQAINTLMEGKVG